MSQILLIRGNTSDFIDHPLPKYSFSARGASHHACVPGPPGSKSGAGETRRFRGIPVEEHCCRHHSSATTSPSHQMNGLFLWMKSSATYRLIAYNIHQLNISCGETVGNTLFHCVNFQKRNFTF